MRSLIRWSMPDAVEAMIPVCESILAFSSGIPRSGLSPLTSPQFLVGLPRGLPYQAHEHSSAATRPSSVS